MRITRDFRPAVSDILETRTVPSGLGGLGGLFGGAGAGLSVPAQDARQVSQAFGKFEGAYFQAVFNDLIQPTTPNTTQFGTDVGTAFTGLNASIASGIKNLGTANPTLASTIQGEVTALQTQLSGLSLTTPSNFRSVWSFERQAGFDIGQTANQVTQQVRQATAPTGSISSTTVTSLLNQVSTAFHNFNQSYSNAIQTDLLAAGTTNPSANGATFQAAVSKAVTALGADLTTNNTALTGLPAAFPTSTLTTTLTNDANNLGTNLQKIALPQSTNFFPMLLFKFRSNITVAQAEGQVIQDILTAVRTYNNALGS